MASGAYQSQKRSLQYSKNNLDRAAEKIRRGCSEEERKKAILMIQNFREVHLYPLMLMKNHVVRTATKVSKKIIVARRLKRLATIIDKLERDTLDGVTPNSIKLTRMQDIGGCRIIVKNLTQLKKVQEKLEKSRSVHKIIAKKDYLTPKSSGYSGVHLIYSCFENSEEDNDWKKTKIEVQIRTELQHAWATSLEIIDTLENIKLKTSVTGYESWRRFFYLSGCLVAHTEKACILDKEKIENIRVELKELASKLKVFSKLFRHAITLNITSAQFLNNKKLKSYKGMFLISMMKPLSKNVEDELKLMVKVQPYKMEKMADALAALSINESDDDILIAALVSAEDARTLRKAYPNYFGSTTIFTSFIQKQLDKIETI